MNESTIRPGGYMDGYTQAQKDMKSEDKPMIVTDEQARINTAIDDVKATLTGRNPSYKIPPASYVDIEILIAQMVLKAERARQAVDDERRIDEVRDTAGYAILILGRLLEASTQFIPQQDMNDVVSDQPAKPILTRTDNDQYIADFSYVSGYNRAMTDNELPAEHDLQLILHGRDSLKICNCYRNDKTDEEFSMYSDGYHQALDDMRHGDSMTQDLGL